MFVQKLLVRSPGSSLISCALVMLAACGSVTKEPTHAEPVGVTTTTPATVTMPTAAATAAATKPEPTLTSAKSGTATTTKPHAPKAKVAAPAPANMLFGAQRTWKIDGHVFPGISAMDEHEASALDGSYIMSQSSLVTPWERCEGPVSTTREATVEEWFASYDARELDETDRATFRARPNAKVVVHDVSCKDATQVELVELSSDKIAIARDGVIFTASRVR